MEWWTRTARLVLVLLFAVLPNVTAVGPDRTVPMQQGDDDQLLFLYPRVGGSGPFLTNDSSVSGSDSHRIAAENSGPSQAMAHVGDGLAAATAEFTFPGLAETRYLNLTRPVVGTLFFRTAATTLGGHDSLALRVELLFGGRILGGADYLHGALASAPEWVDLNLRFWPEARILTAGTPFTVRVKFFSGLTDFMVGTGGDHASDFELHVLPYDAYTRLVILDNSRRETFGSDLGSSGQGQWGPGGASRPIGPAPLDSPRQPVSTDPLALPVLLAPLLALASIGRNASRTTLVLLLLLGAAFAGCMSGKSAGGETVAAGGTTGPVVTERREEREDLKGLGVGALEGRIVGPLGVPVTGVNVAVVGTALFTATDGRGEFRFGNVTAGTYDIMFFKDGYQGFTKEDVVVETGKATILEITFSYATGKGGEHTHEAEWEGQPTKTIVNADYALPKSYAGYGEQVADKWICGSLVSVGACGEIQLQLSPKAKIPPGATQLLVWINWTEGDMDVAEFGLRTHNPVRTGGDIWGDPDVTKTAETTYVARPSGVPFRLSFSPREADPAHQIVTDWQYYLRVPQHGGLFHPFGKALSSGTKVHITMIAVQGVVPYEPRHKDFWYDTKAKQAITELFIIKNRGPNSVTTCCPGDFPNEKSFYWTANELVPPGTKELRVLFRWSLSLIVNVGGPPAPPVPWGWSLAYRSTDKAGTTEYLYPSSETREGNSTSFVLKPTVEQLDQYYQRRSHWKFFVDDRGDSVGSIWPDEPTGLLYNPSDYAAATTKFSLQVIAVKDPAYVYSPT